MGSTAQRLLGIPKGRRPKPSVIFLCSTYISFSRMGLCPWQSESVGYVRLFFMAEPRKTVFISCGQYTEKERELGQKVCALVEKLTPFTGYFAQNQSSVESLTANILHRLHQSV